MSSQCYLLGGERLGAVIGGHVIAAVVVVAVPVAIVVADVAIVVAVDVVGSSLHHHTTSQCYCLGGA